MTQSRPNQLGFQDDGFYGLKFRISNKIYSKTLMHCILFHPEMLFSILLPTSLLFGYTKKFCWGKLWVLGFSNLINSTILGNFSNFSNHGNLYNSSILLLWTILTSLAVLAILIALAILAIASSLCYCTMGEGYVVKKIFS